MSKTMVNSCCSTFSLLCNTRLSMSPILRRVCSSISFTWSPLDPKYCKSRMEKENGSLVTDNYIAIQVCSHSKHLKLLVISPACSRHAVWKVDTYSVWMSSIWGWMFSTMHKNKYAMQILVIFALNSNDHGKEHFAQVWWKLWKITPTYLCV